MVLVPRFAAATGITTLAMFRLVRCLTEIGEAAVSSNARGDGFLIALRDF